MLWNILSFKFWRALSNFSNINKHFSNINKHFSILLQNQNKVQSTLIVEYLTKHIDVTSKKNMAIDAHNAYKKDVTTTWI
jgi:hypothetical protein